MLTHAAVSRGPAGGFMVEEVEIGAIRPDEVLVRMVASGICHTDLVSKAGSAEGVPAVFGHEGAGVVEEVGAQVDGVQPGDHVLLSYASCGLCRYCERGLRAYCRQFGLLNASGARPDGSTVLTQDGEPVWSSFFGQSSFARHSAVRPDGLVVVPPDTDLILSAPMGCGFQTGAGAVANVMRPEPGSSLAVFGTGGVGIAAIMAARALDVETVVAVDLSSERRELALSVGATHAVDGAAADVVEQIRELTRGGADFSFDTTAVPAVVRNAARVLAPLGTAVIVGIGAPEVTFDVMDLIGAGKSVRGCIEGDANPAEMIPRMLDWQRLGRFPVEKIVSTFPFEKIDEAVAASAGPVLKAVLEY